MTTEQKTYQLTITHRQVQALIAATDLLQRVQLGQWREIVDHLPLTESVDYENLHKDLDDIGRTLSNYTISHVDGWSSSLGIGHRDLPPDNGVIYDLHCVLRNKLAWERAVENGIIESENSPRKWPEMMGVDYDFPYKWGDEPLATITRVDT